MRQNNRKSFIKIIVQDPGELKEFLPSFLIEWRRSYPDQLKIHVENIGYSKKISKLEGMKILEDEITEQFNGLVEIYQDFPDPFPIYSLWEITNVEDFLQDFNEYKSVMSKGGIPEFWVWSKDSSFPPRSENAGRYHIITGVVFKKDVNWPLTILKNCELTYGLDEKEVVIFPGRKIQITKIEGNYFTKEFPMKKGEID